MELTLGLALGSPIFPSGCEGKLGLAQRLMRRVDSLEKTDAGRDWGQEEMGTTEDEMAGWHHQLDGHEFGAHQAPLSLGFSRQEHWSGLPFPSQPRDLTDVSCIAGGFFTQ